MKNILYPFVHIFATLKDNFRKYFCRHQMRYWDMKWIVEDKNSHIYERFNDKVWPDSFCQCQKCGIKYKRIYLPKKWGEWKKSDFKPNKTNVIEVEIYEFGTMSKKQKRDRLIENILK